MSKTKKKVKNQTKAKSNNIKQFNQKMKNKVNQNSICSIL